MSVPEILTYLCPGDTIAVEQVLGEPTVLVDELLHHADALPGVRLFVGMSVTGVLTRVPARIGMVSTVGMAANTQLIGEGRMQIVPAHMSQLPWLLSEGPLKVDVALVLLSPPDADGWCSLGVTSDYAWHAISSARVVLAEINDNVPVVPGDTRVHLDQVAYSIRTHRALPEYPRADPSSLERVIAANVARYVRDGSCLQVGIGKLSEAVLQAVADRRDLGIHSGMVGDTMLEMMRDGIITGRAKDVDNGLAVAGSILGSHQALALAAEEKNLRIVSIGQTHDPARIQELSNFVCVNAALEVDLFGQINSETAGGRYVGATGGGVDFLRSSVRAPGGRSIVALPSSTRKGRSRIVPRVETVTALATDVDVITTEHGVAELRGASAGERVERVIAIAAPEHREQLRDSAAEMGL
ncbi:acetyl-CoA hydrolase/transferase C-terminal domain-containing protein [Amycolatopsis carbonis]|uniref:Acetyl-CoA hydrolase/transferase C-terminal domain-containing protein n=1 Tax=Amycolatopsis carbonis TaxID=715471 RepID=A0A9Y2I8B4_9PSEU|nr:acetyl-CoA hydrolase/transferase C-terminal domain-containing protein [Amycolatopsis sp. 2-15]WIX75650.1 acetyl-CoA hydrolase/transferase C-terminal domain-containing protein [Amycolatopsis sp. 2-15]